jgi:hypothetical protein
VLGVRIEQSGNSLQSSLSTSHRSAKTEPYTRSLNAKMPHPHGDAIPNSNVATNVTLLHTAKNLIEERRRLILALLRSCSLLPCVRPSGPAIMCIFETVFHAHCLSARATSNRVNRCELLFTSTHWTAGLWRRWWMALSTGCMQLPNGISILLRPNWNCFSADRANYHPLVLVRSTFGATVCFVLEVVRTKGLSTSIAYNWQKILLIAIRVCTMCAAIAKMSHLQLRYCK